MSAEIFLSVQQVSMCQFDCKPRLISNYMCVISSMASLHEQALTTHTSTELTLKTCESECNSFSLNAFFEVSCYNLVMKLRGGVQFIHHILHMYDMFNANLPASTHSVNLMYITHCGTGNNMYL